MIVIAFSRVAIFSNAGPNTAIPSSAAGLQHSTQPMIRASAAVPFQCHYTCLHWNKELLASSHVSQDRARLVLVLALGDRVISLRKVNCSTSVNIRNREDFQTLQHKKNYTGELTDCFCLHSHTNNCVVGGCVPAGKLGAALLDVQIPFSRNKKEPPI